MSAELIAIFAAAIALGTAMLASIRSVRQDARDRHNELRADMAALDGRLRGELRTLGSELGDGMQTGFKELTTRVVNLGDRLSRVEGIIEGVFWGARNPPTDKPGEGAA